MFSRFFLVPIAATLALVLVAQSGSLAAVLAEDPEPVTIAIADTEARVRTPTADRQSSAVLSSDDSECCKAGLISPVATCAPDSAVAPAASPFARYDRSIATLVLDQPVPVQLIPSGLYRPPISFS